MLHQKRDVVLWRDLLNLERGGGPFSSQLAAVLDIPIRFSFVLICSREESVKLRG